MGNALPKISIVTPSFNQAAFIEQTIDSVLSQNYPSLQYIIIDGGSTDGSPEIIRRYSAHLDHWVSEKDRGQSHAINKGFSRVNGVVFNWLNSDDYLEPHALKTIGEIFSDPRIHVLASRGNVIEDGKLRYQSAGTRIYDGNLEKTIGQARIDQPETWFRKSRIEKLMPVREDLHYVMDKELWIRFLLMFGLEGVKKIDDVLVNFRVHDASKTKSQGVAFRRETDRIYQHLAASAGLPAEKQFIQDMATEAGDVSARPWDVDTEQVRGALQYYFLHQADIHYYEGDTGRTRRFLEMVDVTHLPGEERRLWKKLNFRSRYVPAALIRIMRR